MEKELDPEVIKATQNTLGKYVKRPPLTDKLLKKPPFRFLHDIVTSVMKGTGFFEGLFEENELISDNVKDRESKMVFLNKVIAVIGLTTGQTLSVKPSKIVAGQEPEKTNELLQCLAAALDKKLSSHEAVKKYKESSKTSTETKSKDVNENKAVKSNEKSNDSKKVTSKNSEKLTSKMKDTKERSLTRNDKGLAIKSKKESVVKKDGPPKNNVQAKTLPKKKSLEKLPITDNDNTTNKTKSASSSFDTQDVENVNESDSNDQYSSVKQEKENLSNSTITTTTTPPETKSVVEQSDQTNLNSSYTIAENDLNSSLSSQDLMEVNNDIGGERQLTDKHDDISIDGKISNYDPEKLRVFDYTKNKVEHEENTSNKSEHSSGPQSLTKEKDMKSNHTDIISQSTKTERVQSSTSARPKSVRPSSTRPGAPRLREKHENVINGNDNLLVGKVNIIVENTANEDDEDSSIVIVEHPMDKANDQQEQLQLSSNQHGHLVQQILDSQKEISQITGKTEIEWQFGAQKAREAVNQEIEQLRFNIQALSRVANPLGKLMDHIQEDVEVMRQELLQWTKTYEEASKELQKQKSANEDSLYPLHAKLKQLDIDIEEKHDKINDLKIVLHKNSTRIEKLLASGDVQ